MPDTIHFVMTGGTIDSYYNGVKDTATPRKHSILPDYLELIRAPFQTTFTEVCMKDSRELSLDDMHEVLKTVEGGVETKVIVTHGTYTMPDTARFLKENLKRHDQVIILTGSMIPLEGFSPSDAGFNIGFAIAKLEHLEPGVYICMNGQILLPEETIKLLQEGRFGSIFAK